jgi:hypothetical protein
MQKVRIQIVKKSEKKRLFMEDRLEFLGENLE